MKPDFAFFIGALAGGLGGVLAGYLAGIREGIRRGRPSWEEKEARAAAAWHDGVAFGRYMEQTKKQLGV